MFLWRKYRVVERQVRIGNGEGLAELHSMDTHMGPSQQRGSHGTHQQQYWLERRSGRSRRRMEAKQKEKQVLQLQDSVKLSVDREKEGIRNLRSSCQVSSRTLNKAATSGMDTVPTRQKKGMRVGPQRPTSAAPGAVMNCTITRDC